jgi:hypothetical protein
MLVRTQFSNKYSKTVAPVSIYSHKKKKGKVIPLQAQCGPEGSRRFRLPDFHDIQHLKVVRSSASRTGRLYPQDMFLVLIVTVM